MNGQRDTFPYDEVDHVEGCSNEKLPTHCKHDPQHFIFYERRIKDIIALESISYYSLKDLCISP